MKRQPGRPPLDVSATAPSAPVHLKLSAVVYDKADKIARDNRESIQDLIRRGLKRLLTEEHGAFRNLK